MSSIEITDNSAEVLSEKNRLVRAALEAMGNQAVSYAKSNITEASRVDTGALRNSMSHLVAAEEETVYVGTNQEYAIYNEYGTGIYAEGGRGRQTPWRYQDKKGEWHTTRGIPPIHFLKKAVADHLKEYQMIAESILKGD